MWAREWVWCKETNQQEPQHNINYKNNNIYNTTVHYLKIALALHYAFLGLGQINAANATNAASSCCNVRQR